MKTWDQRLDLDFGVFVLLMQIDIRRNESDNTLEMKVPTGIAKVSFF